MAGGGGEGVEATRVGRCWEEDSGDEELRSREVSSLGWGKGGGVRSDDAGASWE